MSSWYIYGRRTTLFDVGGLTRGRPFANWQQGRLDHANEKDRILVRLSLMANLKPRVILAQHPELFIDVTENLCAAPQPQEPLGAR